jgi:hypothetical protein
MSNVGTYPKIERTLSASGLKSWVIAHRQVLAISLVLIVSALSLRLLTFDRYLPYLDYTDESVPFLIAQNWRGIDQNPFFRTRYAGYPPAFVTLNIGVQQIVEATVGRPWTVPPDYFFALRLLAAFVGTATALVIANIGWQLGGWLAGLLSGLVWALAPIIVEHNSLATPDPYVYLTCAATLSMALYAWRKNSQLWLTGSLIAGILAIYFKLWPIHAVFPYCIVALLLLRQNGRRVFPWLGLQALIAIVAAFYLFQIVRPLDMPAREVQTFNNECLSYLVSPDRNFNNWYFAIYPLGMPLFAGGVIAALAAYWYSRRAGWRVVEWRHLALLFVYSFAGIMMASSFTNVWLEAGKIRHVLPVSLALLPLWGAAVAQVVWVIVRWARQRQLTDRRALYAGAAVPVLIGAVLAPRFISGNVEVIQRFRNTAVQVNLWHWTDMNIPVDGLILSHESSSVAHTWNRPWSGYDGVKTFRWWLEREDQMAASTPERYIERGITYFVMDSRDQQRYYNTPEMKAFLDQLTLVKSFDAPDVEFQYDAYFYRMLPPGYAADATFGDQITLAGYDLNAESVVPGESFVFRPYWRIQRYPSTNYSMFLHLYPADGDQIIAQYDGAPTVTERPTLLWDDLAELYIGGDVSLTVPADTAPGEYRLAIGLYDYTNGPRLTLPDGEDKFTIPLAVR